MERLSDDNLRGLIRKLNLADVDRQLPGQSLSFLPRPTDTELGQLVMHASGLALSNRTEDLRIAYEIVTRVAELGVESCRGLIAGIEAVLTRLGNFPGRKLLQTSYANGDGTSARPMYIKLESIAREAENSVEAPDGSTLLVTDLQYDLIDNLARKNRLSVSAPTSAGKSFVLTLDLVRRLKKEQPISVVYLAPSRALVRQVARTVVQALRLAGLETVLIRTTPVPLPRGMVRRHIVYVLTQERLLALLQSQEGDPWITTLIVDEAQQIGDGARGIVLQTVIEQALRRFPNMQLYFAAPLVENPDELLTLFEQPVEGNSRRYDISPVARNTILVSEVPGESAQIKCTLLVNGEDLDLGNRFVDFRMRAGVYDQRAAFARAVTRAGESTIVYANGPFEAEALALALADLEPTFEIPQEVADLITFIERHVHPEYKLAKALRGGSAFHYGNMPSIVRTRIEDLFAASQLKYICCTSTLLHGVNLPAKHLIVERPTTGSGRAMSRADFLNLAGRAGRLGFEFHGNVWCLRPETWSEQAYRGEELNTIRPAMKSMLADGGLIVEQLLEDTIARDQEADAETLFGKMFVDFGLHGAAIEESVYWKEEIGGRLRGIVNRCQNLIRTLPDTVFERNFQVNPERIELLADQLRHVSNASELVPKSPLASGFTGQLFRIFRLAGRILGRMSDKQCNLHAGVARSWIYEHSLARIITQRVEWQSTREKPFETHELIRELLKLIESGIRYRIVKYVRTYIDVWGVIASEKGYPPAPDAGLALPFYLEAGACKPITLGLIGLGLSRSTAVLLRHKLGSRVPAEWDALRRFLIRIDLNRIQLPAVCKQEIRGWRGF